MAKEGHVEILMIHLLSVKYHSNIFMLEYLEPDPWSIIKFIFCHLVAVLPDSNL